VLPPSVLFQGRRVYWAAAMVVLTVVVSGRQDGYTFERVKREFGVSRQTVKRWQAWYQDEMRGR